MLLFETFSINKKTFQKNRLIAKKKSMSSLVIASVLVIYFIALFAVAMITSKKADNASFFKANKSASWVLVAFGMIGTSLSGVTFVSVPGTVGNVGMQYFTMVLGFFAGYFVVAYVLLPLYYRLNLTSIYSYLEKRFGSPAYELGALFFILSRTVGASLRLFLVVKVIQLLIMDDLGIPFAVTTGITLLMILAYTYKGGVKTIVWTDTLQTFFMLSALVGCVIYILNQLGGWDAAWQAISNTKTNSGLDLAYVFNGDVLSKKYFLKQFLGGAFITIAMTGLDQEMMQKNISVSNLKDSQRNMISFSAVMVVVVGMFLFLGALLFVYMQQFQMAIPYEGDDIFPKMVMDHMPPIMGLLFIVGLVSALFPSADGAITALTSSFCIDLLRFSKMDKSEEDKAKIRKRVHLAFTALFFFIVLYFRWLNEKTIVDLLMDLATYTYGPLLGLFAFGILTKRELIGSKWNVVVICLLSPVLTYLLVINSKAWFFGYEMGVENLIVNGAITFGLLYLRSSSPKAN
jgi:SSS family transporter